MRVRDVCSGAIRVLSFHTVRPASPMDLDIRTVLRWLIIGVIALLGLSLLGLLIEVIRPLLRLVLKAGAIVLVVLLIIRVLEDVRS